MINILNSGNILPFYRSLSHQNRHIGNCGSRAGIIGLSGYALPFQLIVNGTVSASSISLAWINQNNVVFAASGYNLDIKHTADNRSIITYYGGGLQPALTSGLYTLRIQIGSNIYYSEEIQIVESLDCYQQISFSNDCPFDSVYYDGAYTQTWYFKAFEDNPVIEREEEAILNGDNEVIIKSVNVKHKQKIQVIDLLDTMLYPLSLIRDHSTIIYYPQQSGISYFLKEFEISFSVQDEGCLNAAELTFLVDNFNKNACCGTNIEIINQETKTVI